MIYTIAVFTVKNSWWWTEELSETCTVLFQKKIGKLLHLVGFNIRIYHDARSPERQIQFYDLLTWHGITKLDEEKNQCISQKTGPQNITKEIKQYQKKWLQHVQGMDTNRLPKQVLQYNPKGRRNIGRPRKRWRDQLNLEYQGTGNTPNPSGTWWWRWWWWLTWHFR